MDVLRHTNAARRQYLEYSRLKPPALRPGRLQSVRIQRKT